MSGPKGVSYSPKYLPYIYRAAYRTVVPGHYAAYCTVRIVQSVLDYFFCTVQSIVVPSVLSARPMSLEKPTRATFVAL